jgi:hypothetical protein
MAKSDKKDALRDLFFKVQEPNRMRRKRVLAVWGFILFHLLLFVFLLIFLGVVFLYVVGYIGLTVAETPKFCTICHNMKRDYNSYANSGHAGIKCGECHNEPGLKGFIKGEIIAPVKESYLYLSGNYGKKPMSPEMDDGSCLRPECHKVKRLEEKTFVKRGIAFGHKVHMGIDQGGRELQCAACHAYSPVTHMETDVKLCGVCHFNAQAKVEANPSCRECHVGVITFTEKQAFMHAKMKGAKKDCSACHRVFREKVPVKRTTCVVCHGTEFKELAFTAAQIHGLHPHGACFDCHEAFPHTITKVAEKPAESCKACHSDYMDKDIVLFGGIDFSHGPHIENEMECSRCHKLKEHGELTFGNKKFCDECHE